MYNEIIKLVSESKSVDEYGDIASVRTERTVFARLKSIGQSEFYQAQAVGLKPEIKFVLSDFIEYEGEKVVLYTPFRGVETEYTVLRTYRDGNELELVCKRGIEKAMEAGE